MNSSIYLQSFIDLLSKSEKKDYTSIIRNFDFDKVDFSTLENWSFGTYTRNCFYRDENFELILICWDKNQKTKIHDHDGNDCWVYLLEGELTEEFYELDKDEKLHLKVTNTLQSKQITKSGNRAGFHRLKTKLSKRAMSLHVYAKPIDKSRYYDETLDKLVEKELSYCSYKPLNILENIN